MSSIEQAKVEIVFGTDTGNTEEIAGRIVTQLEQHGASASVTNITDADTETFDQADLLILGIPTWDFGGIQADWDDVEAMLTSLELGGKTIALYGLGDQFGYGDYFLDAMGWLYQRLQSSQARFIGFWSVEGYDFEASEALVQDGKLFCGLAVDEDQQFELTDQRIEGWVNQIVAEYSGQQPAA